MGSICKRKLDILHNAKEGRTFTIIDETGELKKMVKEFHPKVKAINLEDGKVKYIFNPIKE